VGTEALKHSTDSLSPLAQIAQLPAVLEFEIGDRPPLPITQVCSWMRASDPGCTLNGDGTYEFTNVHPGEYSITVSADGLRRPRRTGSPSRWAPGSVFRWR
jgi:hypothetical protein